MSEEQRSEVWLVRFKVFAERADVYRSTNSSSVWVGNKYLAMPNSVTTETVQKAVFDAMDECVRVVTTQIDSARECNPNWTLKEPA